MEKFLKASLLKYTKKFVYKLMAIYYTSYRQYPFNRAFPLWSFFLILAFKNLSFYLVTKLKVIFYFNGFDDIVTALSLSLKRGFPAVSSVLITFYKITIFQQERQISTTMKLIIYYRAKKNKKRRKENKDICLN